VFYLTASVDQQADHASGVPADGGHCLSELRGQGNVILDSTLPQLAEGLFLAGLQTAGIAVNVVGNGRLPVS